MPYRNSRYTDEQLEILRLSDLVAAVERERIALKNRLDAIRDCRTSRCWLCAACLEAAWDPCPNPFKRD